MKNPFQKTESPEAEPGKKKVSNTILIFLAIIFVTLLGYFIYASLYEKSRQEKFFKEYENWEKETQEAQKKQL